MKNRRQARTSDSLSRTATIESTPKVLDQAQLGAVTGGRGDVAYFVRCDRETTTG